VRPQGPETVSPPGRSASHQAYSPVVQVKAAAAQVGDLDWNEEKKAVIAHYGGSNNGFSAVALPDQ
jgi:hypothetical protein